MYNVLKKGSARTEGPWGWNPCHLVGCPLGQRVTIQDNSTEYFLTCSETAIQRFNKLPKPGKKHGFLFMTILVLTRVACTLRIQLIDSMVQATTCDG
jgi:hypothetical protein